MSLFNKEDYKNKKSLIIYFSRADENYVGGQVNSSRGKVGKWI